MGVAVGRGRPMVDQKITVTTPLTHGKVNHNQIETYGLLIAGLILFDSSFSRIKGDAFI
jgi:hypothetical protein